MKVVVTDYPDVALIENLRFNISTCGQLPKDCDIHAEVRRTCLFSTRLLRNLGLLMGSVTAEADVVPAP